MQFLRGVDIRGKRSFGHSGDSYAVSAENRGVIGCRDFFRKRGNLRFDGNFQEYGFIGRAAEFKKILYQIRFVDRGCDYNFRS